MSKGVNKVILDSYQSGMSIPEVSRETGIALSTIRFMLKRHGVLRSRQEAIQLAAKQGKLGVGLRGKHRTFSDAHKDAIRRAAIERGERTATGTSVKPNGYVEITRGDHKGRGEHRVIAEMMLGRELMMDEVVHHMDHNRCNNNPSNLEVMTRSEHVRLHALENHKNRTRNLQGQFQ